MYQKIKGLCEKNGISVSRLEKELSLSNGSVSKWDSSIPRANTLLKIANYFSVPISQFFETESNEEGATKQ